MTVVARAAAAAVALAAVDTATVITFCLELAGSIRLACTLALPPISAVIYQFATLSSVSCKQLILHVALLPF